MAVQKPSLKNLRNIKWKLPSLKGSVGQGSKALSNKELFHFCKQFSIILHSSTTITDALLILRDESVTPEGAAFMMSLHDRYEETHGFALTLQESGAFPESMVQYVYLGEFNGRLDEVMNTLADYYEQEIEISAQIRSAVTYPLIMLGMMLTIVVILLTKILPVFAQVFRQMGLEIGGVSGWLLNLGKGMAAHQNIFLAVLALILCGVLFLVFSETGKELLRDFVCAFPAFQEVRTAIDYSRLCRGISMGLRSDLSPEDSIEMARYLVTIPAINEKLHLASDLIRESNSYAGSLIQSGLFTGVNASLVSIGFHNGKQDQTMEYLANRYQEDSTNLIGHAISILEPSIVVVMTILVGFVLVSVMLPLLEILTEMMG